MGLSFNPSGSGAVENIKRRTVDLIGETASRRRTTSPKPGALKALAMTAVEVGPMWEVKAVTKHAHTHT